MSRIGYAHIQGNVCLLDLDVGSVQRPEDILKMSEAKKYLYAASLFLFIYFLLVINGSGQSAEHLTEPGKTPSVWGILEKPSTPGPHPGVILLHGSNGWRPLYGDYARALAEAGFVTLSLDYYADAGSAPIGSEEKLQKWPLWQSAVRSAVLYMKSLPEVSDQNIGLVGFSRGAFLAVSMANSMPEVRAVVDFYGGGGGGTVPFEDEVKHFPPLLILHGGADRIVPVAFAERLREAVSEQGGNVEMYIYPDARHAFNASDSPTYSKDAAEDSFKRTVAFLSAKLAR